MALKTFKPVTPGLRQLVIVDRSGAPQGQAGEGADRGQVVHRAAATTGRITVRFRGGGHKRTYRMVDFKRRKLDMPAKVERLEYDPNRTSFIALIRYADGDESYIIAPQRLRPATRSGGPGRREARQFHAAADIPVGTIVHNVEMKIGKGGAMARSAGTYAQLVGRDQGTSLLASTPASSASFRAVLGHGRGRVEPRP